MVQGARRTSSRTRVQDPEPCDVRRAVAALHGAQRGNALLLLAGLQLRLAQAQLRVLGALQPALLDALLDERQSLRSVTLVHVVEPDLDELVSVFRRERFLLVLGAVL